MQISLSPEIEALIERQLSSGKYKTAIEVLLAGMHLLDEQETLYQGRLAELQNAAKIGWQASQRGEVVDGSIAMNQILTDLRSRYPIDHLLLACHQLALQNQPSDEAEVQPIKT